MGPPLRSTFRAGAALLACAALAAVAAPASAAPLFGVHVQRVSEFESARMKAGRVGYVRKVFQWREVQPERDSGYRWDRYDSFMLGMALHGIPVLPVILGTPDFAAGSAGKQPRGREDVEAYTRWVRALVDRYGNGGTLWRDFPVIPAQPVTHWQVWNEPNLQHFWAGKLEPGRYARFLALSRRAITNGDPDAKIVLAGMPETKQGLPMSTYLKGLYRVKGFAKLVDVVTAHNYAPTAERAIEVLELERRIMDRNGSRGTPIWVTELGWASAGPRDHPLVKDPALQAKLLTRSFRLLSRRSRDLGIGAVFWYDWRDRGTAPGEPDHFSYHTGLFRANREPKPAWQAFTDFVGGDPGDGRVPPGLGDLGLTPGLDGL
jgi:hypothetical protein